MWRKGEPVNAVATLRRAVIRLKDRVLQLLALYSPGATTVRVALHRLRGVRIGERVFIGTSTIIETDRPELVTIGNEVTLSIRVVIVAHFKKSLGVTIEDEVFLGPGVIVLPGVTIGRGAVVTAGSVVAKTVAPRHVVQGNPARPIATCDVPLIQDVSLEDFQRGLHVIRRP